MFEKNPMQLPMLKIYRAICMRIAICVLPLIATLAASPSYAQAVNIQSAWANPTVPGQTSSSAFMKLTASSDTRLIAVSTPVAGVAEVHEMKMSGAMMTMRAVTGGLPLPKGKTIDLTPGGYHIMLMDLKQPLAKGSSIPLTLVFKAEDGSESKYSLNVPVASALNTDPSASGNH